jgi:hypothetical protein
LAAHYRALLCTPVISSGSEAAHRELSTATSHHLRQELVHNGPALGASFPLEDSDQAHFHMANHNPPGADCVPAERLKCCAPQGKELLLPLCTLIHGLVCNSRSSREEIPVSIPKSGDLVDCSSYRGLALLQGSRVPAEGCRYRYVPSNGRMPVPYRSYRGSRSNNIDLLRQGVPSMVPGMHGM